MKKIGQTALMLFLISSLCAQTPSNTVNPVIGDESFVMLFGVQPDQYTNEQLRVQAHLAYVESKLRERSTDGLSGQQKQNRERVLNLLHEYWTNGVFPSNYDYPEERRPCFIDRDGTICAVGFLVEKTAGIEVAREINEKHQYDRVMDMNEPVLEAWAEENGLTLEECATIQPQYNNPLPPSSTTYYQSIDKGYGIASGFLGGFNLAVNAVNFSGRFGNGRTLPFLGLLTGTTQLIMGIAGIQKDDITYSMTADYQVVSHKAQNNLSYLNIAFGTTTIITSALNLHLNKKMKNKKNAVGLYSYPGLNNEMNVGFTFARKL